MSAGTSPGRGHLCRRLLTAEAVLLVALLVALPFAGRLAHREDALERADVAFVLGGERVNRWLEAGDLLREGWVPRILLSTGYREHNERALLARGVAIPSEAEVARGALIQLGHPPEALEILGAFPDNTAEEGVLLRDHAQRRGWTRVIVVTSKLHSRRAGFAMEREMRGTGIRIIVRPSRYDDDNPSRWWTKRRTIRTLLSELPKLVAYVLGLGP
jgi:uncharacterized SAM-binding protein YcdF (DUF218 family)